MTPSDDNPVDGAPIEDPWDGARMTERVTARAAELHHRHRVRRFRIVAGAAGLGATAIIALVAIVLPTMTPDGAASPTATTTLSATALREGAAGGLVLAGLIGFALGTVVTILCLKAARRLR